LKCDVVNQLDRRVFLSMCSFSGDART
jgi:hypothetical protein